MARQKITNINSAVWEEIKAQKRLGFLFIGIGLAGNIFFSFLFFGPLFLLPWVPLIFWIAYIYKTARQKFWKQFAKNNGWVYEEDVSLESEEALIFFEGHSQKIPNMVSGHMEEMPVRIFEYQFTRGHGKHQTTHYYTAFGFRFEGSFPHLYLNQRDHGYDVRGKGVRIPVPLEFEKQFDLYGPEQYEVEALEIFTPDVFAYLLDEQWPHDVELVDKELLVFRHKFVNTKQQLDTEFAQAQKLMERMKPVLNRVQFEKIGDNSPFLKDDSWW